MQMKVDDPTAPWVADLMGFLRTQSGVEAVRVDPTGRKIAVATLGPVDLAEIEAQLAGTLAAIEAHLGSTGGTLPSQRGYVVSRTGDATVVARESCATAPNPRTKIR